MKRFVLVSTCMALLAGNLGSLLASSWEDKDFTDATRYLQEVNLLCQRDGGQLWGLSLNGPIMFVKRETREVIANQCDAEGHLKQHGSLFVGQLPSDLQVANTSLGWGGTDWVVLLWPLPADDVARKVLMMHESWHRVQERLELPASNPTNEHLNSFDGRFWIQLEWRALGRALMGTGDERRAAIKDALLFRRRRHQKQPQGAEQEFLLETNEGLAEYTGVRLSGMSTGEQCAYVARQLKQRPAQFPSFTRSFAYLTGPAYGCLLDATGSSWRKGLQAGDDLATKLQTAMNIQLENYSDDQLIARAQQYDAQALRTSELEREKARAQRHAELEQRYCHGHVLRAQLQEMQITFDPRNVEASANWERTIQRWK